MEFPGWTDKDSIKAYISRVRKYLLDDDSRQALDKRLPQEAIDMLFKRLVGRFRPATVTIEKIFEGIEQGAWQFAIEDTEDSWYLGHTETSRAICATSSVAYTTNVTNTAISSWSLSTTS